MTNYRQTIQTVVATLEARFTAQKFSWAGLAKTLGLKDHKILDARKRPIPGAIYDPESNNYEAIARVICGLEKAPNVELIEQFKAITDEQWEALASNARGFGGVNKKYIQMDEIVAQYEKYAGIIDTPEGEERPIEPGTYWLWYAPRGVIRIRVLHITSTHIACENMETDQLYAWGHKSFMDYAPNHNEPTPEDLTRKPKTGKGKNGEVVSYTIEEYREAAIQAANDNEFINGDTLESVIESLEAADEPAEVDRICKIYEISFTM